MDGIILITIGLVFDICGAFLILKPLLNRMKWIDPKNEQGARLQNYSIRVDDEKAEWKHQVNARYGLGFLITGFLLQIIGNYFQYLNSIK